MERAQAAGLGSRYALPAAGALGYSKAGTQQLSYDPPDPWFDIDGWRIALQIITFENVYGLDPEATVVTAATR